MFIPPPAWTLSLPPLLVCPNAHSVREADAKRLRGETQKINREMDVDEDEQLYLDRCDAGLCTLQQVDIVIVRLANMGNRQVSDEITKLLDIKGVPLKEVLDTVEEYRSQLDSSARPEKDELRNYARTIAKRGGLPDPCPAEDEDTLTAAAATPPAAPGQRTPSPQRENNEKKEKKEKREKKRDKDKDRG